VGFWSGEGVWVWLSCKEGGEEDDSTEDGACEKKSSKRLHDSAI